jgi:hypothetical protein
VGEADRTTTNDQRSVSLRVGWILLAVSAFGFLAAPISILLNIPDFSTRPSRHAFAGALGLAALAVLEFLLAVIPIRRGETWALIAAGVPFVVVGVPVFIVDATNVAPERLWRTLAPQVAGLVVGTAAWVLCVVGIRRRAT